MRLPSKITPYCESSLLRLVRILELIKEKDVKPSDILGKVKEMSSSEAIEAMDALFALGMVELSEDGRSLHYVGRD